MPAPQLILDLIDRFERNSDAYKSGACLSSQTLRLVGQAAATDRQIDKLVYELYDLTEEEIKIVEGQ